MTSAFHLPTPRLLYVHDNLTPFVRERYGRNSLEYETTQLFIKHIAAQPHVRIGTLEEELAGLVAQTCPFPFDATFGLGYKGEEIAEFMHGRWEAFPRIHRLDITRREKANGKGHELASQTEVPIDEQLAQAGEFKTFAVVDDVLFTGFTARSILELLPLDRTESCHLFFTRGIEETKKELERMGCTIHLGATLKGQIETDVSTISTMNLITEGAIRTQEGDKSYCERGEWMEAWFPNRADTIKHLCQALTTLFESVSQEEKKIKPHVIAEPSAVEKQHALVQ